MEAKSLESPTQFSTVLEDRLSNGVASDSCYGYYIIVVHPSYTRGK